MMTVAGQSVAVPAKECALASGEDHAGVDRTAAEHRAAFERLVPEHQQRITRLACRLLGWNDDVEDVVQDVFLSAWANLGRFQGRAALSTWLTRITINACRSHRRRRMLRFKWLTRTRSEAPPAASSPADQPLVERQKFERIRAVIQKLPMRYREVVVLRYLEQVPIERMVELLGVSRNAIEVRLHRARRRLADELADLMEP